MFYIKKKIRCISGFNKSVLGDGKHGAYHRQAPSIQSVCTVLSITKHRVQESFARCIKTEHPVPPIYAITSN